MNYFQPRSKEDLRWVRFLSLDALTSGPEPGKIYADPKKGSTQDKYNTLTCLIVGGGGLIVRGGRHFLKNV